MGLILESALELANLGLCTFPVHSVRNGACSCSNASCTSQGKHPRISGWKHRATNDANALQQLLSDDDNIGIATGRKSKLLVIDVDPKNDGDNSFAKLKSRFDPIDETTLVANTGGGGCHLYYRYCDNKIKNNHGLVFGPGIDIKANGGYVVGAPSVHLSGKRYEWRDGLYQPSGLPLDIAEAILNYNAHPSITSDLKKPKVILEGERNTTLTRIAGRYRAQGNDFDELYSRLQTVNVARCSPPLYKSEVKKIAKSISRYEKGNSKGCFRDFWVACLFRSDTRGLTHSTKGVLVALSQLMDKDGGNCTAHQELIASKAACSVPTVSKQIGKAVKLGWLKQWHLPKTNGDKGIYCKYVANLPGLDD